MNQADTIVKFKNGNSISFSELVETWQDKIYNTAIGIIQNEEDAEDITQDVFVTLYEKLPDFREASLLSTWLYRITVTKALDLEKRKKRQKRGGILRRVFTIEEIEEPANFDHPGVLLDNKEMAAVLFNTLKKLPEQQRIAFTLQKLEGLSNQDIAGIMNTSVAAIESLHTRAKTNLKHLLGDFYNNNL